MGIYCCAFGCKEKFVKGGRLTFHCFPKDEERKKVWVQNIRRKDFVPSVYTRICSKHFEDDCFDRNRFGGTWLTPEAAPTIFVFSEKKSVNLKPPAKPTKGQKIYRNTSNIVQSDHRPKSPVVFIKIAAEPSTPEGKLYRYIGDFEPEDMDCPVKARKALEIAKRTIKRKIIEIKKLQRVQTNFKKKLAAMQPILQYLKNKDFKMSKILDEEPGQEDKE